MSDTKEETYEDITTRKSVTGSIYWDLLLRTYNGVMIGTFISSAIISTIIPTGISIYLMVKIIKN